MSRLSGRVAWAAVFVVATVVQLVAIYTPSPPGEGGIPYIDKVVHVTIFAVPVLAGLLAGLPGRVVVAVFAVHAPVSEWLQSTDLVNRDGGWADATADLLGVAAGAAIAVALLRHSRTGTRVA